MDEKFPPATGPTTHAFPTRRAWTLSAIAALVLGSLGCSSEGSSFNENGGSGPGPGNNNSGNATGNGGTGNNNTQGGTGNNNTQGGTGNNNTQGGTGNNTGGADNNGGTGGGMVDQGPPCPKPDGQICHEFYANDNARNVLNYVNEFDPTKNWSANVGDTGVNSPRQLSIVDNAQSSTGKAVLVSLNKGYAEFDTGTKERLVYVQTYSGITGAARLPNGETALGNGGTMRIAGANGAEVRSFSIPGSGDLRVINRNPADGHFWLARGDNIYETSETGAELWSANLGGGSKGYAVWWRDGGGAYATTGAISTIVEVDANKQVVNTLGGKDTHANVGLDFFSGFVHLPNGNFVAANWLGHLAAPKGDTPHLVEFNQNNEIVWQWGNQELARQITNVLILR
jgi:hypothetical protein